MKYQLVLQFPFSDLVDYDSMIELETLLEAKLPPLVDADIDGHDAGMGEMNIFIITSEPQAAFDAAVKYIGADLIKNMRAGCREVGAEDYTPLWPEDSTEFQVQ